MSINPELIRKPPENHQQEATEQQARDAVTSKITKVLDTINSGLSLLELARKPSVDGETEAILFVMNERPKSHVATVGNVNFMMEREELQRVALDVMGQFGFDENTSHLTFNSQGYEKRRYPSSLNNRLAFDRNIFKGPEGIPMAVAWQVVDTAMMLPEPPLPEPAAE